MTRPSSLPPQSRRERGISLAHKAPPPSGDYHWVYLWEWPIRAMHWIAAGSIVVLLLTGFYIGEPAFLTSGSESRAGFLMGWVRFLHFAAAAALVATAIVRAYWFMAGNQFERWTALFPVRPRDWVNLWKQVKFYLMIQPEKAPHYLGHNPLQQFSYTGMYAVAALMAVTGFTLFGQYNPGGFWYSTTEWITTLAGGVQVVRVVHHIAAWAFPIFVPIHIYLAMRADLLERTGTISSIVSGGRFVRADVTYVDE
jgi:Ni/Fe-hydrogenase 1 B-type cytochrome subunit